MLTKRKLMKGVKKMISVLVRIISITRMKLLMLPKAKKPDHFACKMGLQTRAVSVRPVSYWLDTQGNGYPSVSGVSLNVRVSLSVMGILLGVSGFRVSVCVPLSVCSSVRYPIG
jgi:hypothetical protein